MDRYISDEQLDRAINGFLVERGDEIVASAISVHRTAATSVARAGSTSRLVIAFAVALMVALLASAGVIVGSQLLRLAPSTLPQIGTYIPAESRVTGSLATTRVKHTATLLDDGRVLIVGGWSDSGGWANGPTALASAEIYDPATGQFTPTGSMTTPRYSHSAVRLMDGRVLVVAGIPQSKANGLASAELFDPATGTFTPTGSMPSGVEGQSATLLSDGRVAVFSGGAAEVWNPSTGNFTAGPATDISTGTSTLLPDGQVLLIGLSFDDQLVPTGVTPCLWSPATTCRAAGSMAVARMNHTATLLNDGRVLVVGGETPAGDSWTPVATAELWDPRTLTFSPAGTLPEGRANHTATLLADGRVLIQGGTGAGSVLATAEIWDPATASFAPTASLTSRRFHAASTRLTDGTVLTVGGQSGSVDDRDVLASAEVWQPLP